MDFKIQKALEISPENFKIQKLGENFEIQKLGENFEFQKALENSPENFEFQKALENSPENFKIQKALENFPVRILNFEIPPESCKLSKVERVWGNFIFKNKVKKFPG